VEDPAASADLQGARSILGRASLIQHLQPCTSRWGMSGAKIPPAELALSLPCSAVWPVMRRLDQLSWTQQAPPTRACHPSASPQDGGCARRLRAWIGRRRRRFGRPSSPTGLSQQRGFPPVGVSLTSASGSVERIRSGTGCCSSIRLASEEQLSPTSQGHTHQTTRTPPPGGITSAGRAGSSAKRDDASRSMLRAGQ
jgi:hypothetical protein